MATDAYIKIDGIDGQSTDKGHSNWVDVLAFNVGTLQNVTAGRAVESSGRGELEPFTFVHVVDKATPKLQEATISGKNIKNVEFHVAQAVGGAQTPVLEIKLEQVKIIHSSITLAKEGFANEQVGTDKFSFLTGQLVEEVSLAAGKISWKVTPIKPDGTKDGAVETKWNVLQNTAG